MKSLLIHEAARPPDEHAPCLAMSETTGIVSSGSEPIAARSISEHQTASFGSRSARSRFVFSARSWALTMLTPKALAVLAAKA